ncbi:MAG: HoxN/HupN/NixA family nickel/cobalt transporter [Candidatus Dormibacteraeota bacterium]|uniref:Nickel/cobalt efflux system n=1 Tax=Candidatus Aeolococcus gillhamiae TaxID=3127015 RepID=A0A2W5YY74_9BACT|nr:HoxN/HupN/NixA family nickel/cobalt transporter [Candidatus Dormibacteraeota bacterium]PZR77872.1 MAG: HoxN/HupN/NixA family nickel/cobalt transporter [Candidatus Dormibacter sp. RRmetagenome_bin12]
MFNKLGRMRRTLSRAEWIRLGLCYAAVLALHVVGFGVLLLLSGPRYDAKVFGVGIGLTAYGFGLRHAFDADHISAIDNTTRKLIADGKRPVAVGFFFSLGHSTIVVALTAIIAVAAGAVATQVSTSGSALHSVGGLIGTGVSGFFLYAIAAINLVILVGIVRIFRQMRRGEFDEPTLEKRLLERGLMNRLLGPIARSIRSSWQMYPVGLLFGLGFDTATEVGLLAIGGGAAASGLPWYAIMCLPILFTAGMSLMDTADGAFMNVAYGWAFSKPVRKVFYNLTITGLSVAVALMVGTVELLSILGQTLNLQGGAWGFLSSINLNTVGFIIVGMFVITWLGALAVWRFARIEERWALTPAAAEPEQPPVLTLPGGISLSLPVDSDPAEPRSASSVG